MCFTCRFLGVGKLRSEVVVFVLWFSVFLSRNSFVEIFRLGLSSISPFPFKISHDNVNPFSQGSYLDPR